MERERTALHGAVARIVDRLHVSCSAREVLKAVRKRARPEAWKARWLPIGRAALQVHRDNQGVFRHFRF